MLEVLAPVSSVPRPRLHLIRFHGVLAPNAKFRSKIVPAPAECARETSSEDAHAPPRAPARMNWARLLKRGLRHRHRTLPELRQRFEDHRRPFDTLRHRRSAGDRPDLSYLGLPTRTRRVAPVRRVDLFRTIWGAETASQRGPTARAGS